MFARYRARDPQSGLPSPYLLGDLLRACANRRATFRTWHLSEGLNSLLTTAWHIRYSPIGAASKLCATLSTPNRLGQADSREPTSGLEPLICSLRVRRCGKGALTPCVSGSTGQFQQLSPIPCQQGTEEEFPVYVLLNRCQRSQHYQTSCQEQHVGSDFGDPDEDRPPPPSNEAVSRGL